MHRIREKKVADEKIFGCDLPYYGMLSSKGYPVKTDILFLFWFKNCLKHWTTVQYQTSCPHCCYFVKTEVSNMADADW